MTNPEHFRRLCHAHLNNCPINTFTNCIRMANVIAWNCNPKDPTSYYWDDKYTTRNRSIAITHAFGRVSSSSVKLYGLILSLIDYHMIFIVLGDHYDDSVIITDKSIKDNVRPYKLTEDDETLSNVVSLFSFSVEFYLLTNYSDHSSSIPNTESASMAITTVSQNVEYNLNTDFTSSEICLEKTIKCTSAPRRYNVKSSQYPSITSPEHNGNNSVTTIHSTTK
ncbi:hypothetical protein AGLY_009477 [Aphis glycines]|uniref:Uncharacterized protein n=1 Tax=Aphis glycines TaxID=307491 RepID=A0A6G0THJ2_APHGL|nr:hypothetical protein AGLY_009477 [Aphis glycines]